MFRTITEATGLVGVALLAGCDIEDAEPGPSRADEGVAEPYDFTVELGGATSAEAVTQAILAAAREPVADACAGDPGAAVRIFSALAAGGYADVSCEDILDGTAEASAAPAGGDGQVGVARQPLGPISALACAAFVGGTSAFLRYGLCPRGRTERDRTRCNDVGLWGGIGLGIMCAIPF